MLINTPICTYNNTPCQNRAAVIRVFKKASSRFRDKQSGGGPTRWREEERDEGKKEGRAAERCSFVVREWKKEKGE